MVSKDWYFQDAFKYGGDLVVAKGQKFDKSLCLLRIRPVDIFWMASIMLSIETSNLPCEKPRDIGSYFHGLPRGRWITDWGADSSAV